MNFVIANKSYKNNINIWLLQQNSINNTSKNNIGKNKYKFSQTNI